MTVFVLVNAGAIGFNLGIAIGEALRKEVFVVRVALRRTGGRKGEKSNGKVEQREGGQSCRKGSSPFRDVAGAARGCFLDGGASEVLWCTGACCGSRVPSDGSWSGP